MFQQILKTIFACIAITLVSKSSLANVNDTLSFDLNQATYTTVTGVSYIDVPVVLKSTDPGVNAIDFWFQFDLSKLTYNSTSTTISGFDVFSNYNSSNQNLSNTSSGTSVNFALPLNAVIMTVRFELLNSCLIIQPSDFNTTTALVNGNLSSYEFVAPQAPSPIALLTPAPHCQGSAFDFSYGSTIYGRSIIGYNWDLGNGTQSALQNPSASYSLFGGYTVSLDVVGDNGCTYTIPAANVFVNALPQAVFTYTFDTLANQVNFVNSSTIDLGQISSYSWNFGDFTSSNLSGPSHIYPSHAVYTVDLTVISDSGCVSSTQQIISTELGVEEIQKRSVLVFPNPTVEYMSVVSPIRTTACIYSSAGDLVSESFTLLPNQPLQIDVSYLAVGNYCLVFTNNSFLENIIFQIKK